MAGTVLLGRGLCSPSAFLVCISYHIVFLDLISLASVPKSEFCTFMTCLKRDIHSTVYRTAICYITVEDA